MAEAHEETTSRGPSRIFEVVIPTWRILGMRLTLEQARRQNVVRKRFEEVLAEYGVWHSARRTPPSSANIIVLESTVTSCSPLQLYMTPL
jgi:hypothetical protein